VHYSVNTRILKQQARGREGAGEDRWWPVEDRRRWRARAGTRRRWRRAIHRRPSGTDIKWRRDCRHGEWTRLPSQWRVMVMQIDPERAKQMREMQANYGKT